MSQYAFFHFLCLLYYYYYYYYCFFYRREVIRQLVLRYLAKRSRVSDNGIKPSVSVELACKQAIQI